MKIFLPPTISGADRLTCTRGVVKIEVRLRLAQAEDSLAEVKRLRRVYVALVAKYKIDVRGTGKKPTTRARALLRGVADRVARAANRYRAAHSALVELDPSILHERGLQVLDPKDIRGPYRGEDESEGRRVMSWIWHVRRGPKTGATSSEEPDDVMLSEWTRSWARSQHHEDEVRLTIEDTCWQGGLYYRRSYTIVALD